MSIHPSVKDVIRHVEAGFPILSIPLIGTEQERFAASFSDAIKGDKECTIVPIWFDIVNWPNLVNLLTNEKIPAIAAPEENSNSPFDDQNDSDPLAPINAINWLVAQAEARQEKDDKQFVLLLSNVHTFFASDGGYEHATSACQTLRNAITKLKAVGHSVILIGPETPRNPSLERVIVELDAALPTVEEMAKLAQDMRANADLHPLSNDNAQAAGRAAAGLTFFEAENIFSLLSQACQNEDDAFALTEVVRHAKAVIEETPGLELLVPRDNDQIENLIGLDYARDAILSMLNKPPTHPKARAKGVIFNGLAGTGKSDLCRKLGVATGRKVFRWNPRNSQGGIVGETERNVRNVFRVVRAAAPCILVVDEADSAFSGTESSGRVDGGLMKGVVGYMQTMMQEMEEDVFVAFSTNDLSLLPGPMKRSGRIDEIFWFGYPRHPEILKMFVEVWCPYYGYENFDEQDVPSTTDWVGADVEAAVRKAVGRRKRLDQIRIAPSALVMGADIKKWSKAANGTLDATTGEIMLWAGSKLTPASYQPDPDVKGKRHIKRRKGKPTVEEPDDPSIN